MKLFAGQFATKLMLFATYALALTAAVAVLLEIVLVWNVDDHGMMVELTELERRGDEPPLEPALESMPQLELNVSEPALSQQEAENVFLELVKRRMSIKTPLDTSFYRPFARANKDAKNRAGGGNQTNLIFVAGAEGTGHHFITALMMRLSELMPMSLTQEQMFQSLWWNPDDNDPAQLDTDEYVCVRRVAVPIIEFGDAAPPERLAEAAETSRLLGDLHGE